METKLLNSTAGKTRLSKYRVAFMLAVAVSIMVKF